jgi:glucosylceramidase
VFPSTSQYYGPEGIGYSILRIPIGGTDFSTRFYTYNDGTPDVLLSRFKLAEEDYKYKVRITLRSIQMHYFYYLKLKTIYDISL